MEKRILLPTDFSDNSWSAIVYALKLYKDEVCTFYFLNSIGIEAPTMTYTSNRLLKTMRENALKEMLELKDMAENSNINSNHKFDIIISSEDLNESIENAVNKYDIDLIIMGTLGATNIGEFFFGTNTVHLVNNVRACPVLILPEEFDFVEPKQIAFPTDFNHFYSEKEIEPLLKLADLYNAKIRVVHINIEESLDELQKYNLIVLKSYLHNYEHSFHWMPDYAKITTEINDFITDLDIDVLAMVNYKHSFIEKLIKEPVIKKIGIQPQVPFLVIPE
ncbi:universal stress protein [Gaetbulibacter sp. M235]|uniref:universal stress protein n=1 Tax=Gaetbulibacter sp. M235 TaxID=3126510 RepID=UPI00374F83CF